MQIYLSGPMTGLPDHNAPEFHRLADQIHAMGYSVINPSEINAEVLADNPLAVMSYRTLLPIDIRELAKCDGIALMPGWQKSKGAKFELVAAEIFEMQIFDAETMRPFHETVLKEAERLVHGDRGATYGHPLDDYSCTAQIANGMLGPYGADLLKRDMTAEEAILFMVAVKLSRLSRSWDHRDSVTDGCGYLQCFHDVRTERARREEATAIDIELLAL